MAMCSWLIAAEAIQSVDLLDSDGVLIETKQTNSDGRYSFENYPAGKYTIVAPDAEEGCVDISDEDESTGENDLDGSPDPINNMIEVILTPGESDEDNNFVDQSVGLISGNVSEDTTDDGKGDTPIQNVEIRLLNESGNPAKDATGTEIDPFVY